jgi:autotransporter-associated beta strand protein
MPFACGKVLRPPVKLRSLFPLLALILGSAVCARGQVVYTWTGAVGDDSWDSAANWLGGILPPDDTVNTQVVFGSATDTTVHYDQIYVNQLTFIGNTKGYYLDGNLLGYFDGTTIGSGGIVYTPASPVRSTINDYIQLVASQTWNIQSGSLLITGNIDDSSLNYQLTKTGAGTLLLGSNYSNWSGGLTLTAGSVSIAGYDDGGIRPLGNGTLTFNGGTLIATYSEYAYSSEVASLQNPIISNGLIRTVNHVPVDFSHSTVTLAANTTVDTSGKPFYLESNISGAFKLTLNGTGRLMLSGTNTYTGGTDVTNGLLIFRALAALPALPATNALTTGANGYLGMGDRGSGGLVGLGRAGDYNFQTAFLDRFNQAATFGTIGLDTDPGNSNPTEFSGPVNLTGFGASAKLGSATSAILTLTGTITPQGTDYRFGGGGGWLEVDSTLTGSRGLVVDSPAAYPLTLRLAGSNVFTGSISVTNSAAIFTYVALPSGSRTVAIGAGGYVGTETGMIPNDDTPNDSDISYFLGHITLNSVGMIGFDAAPGYGSQLLTRPIDLSGFTGALYLGTSTVGSIDTYGVNAGLTMSGPIKTTNGEADPYRFAGYKGGILEVQSPLSGAHGVVIGDPNSPATFGDYNLSNFSTVYLNSDNNALTGNVTLYAGQLFAGQTNGVVSTNPTTALGSGTIIVQPMSFPAAWTALGNTPTPGLGVSQAGTIIANPFTLNTNLRISEYSKSLQLTGKISGTGQLYLEAGRTLVLTNNTNDFSGGIYLSKNSILSLGADHASGNGALSFGGSSSQVNFGTAAPVINGLVSNSDDDNTTLSATLANTLLNIKQSFNSQFQGEFRSTDISDSLRIVKTGGGTLVLEDGGLYFHHGTPEASLPATPEVSLQINQGQVVIGNNFHFEDAAPTVWVHGGTLTIDHTYNVRNPVIVDNGGRLTGTGTIENYVTFFSGTTVSPGVAANAGIGSLTFNDLTLMGGATLEWNLRDPNGSAGTGYDLISITDYSATLHVDASVTSGTPFTIKLISLNASGAPGTATGFLNQVYTWTVFDAHLSNIVFGGGSFDASAFHLDTSAFTTDAGPGNFAFVQSGDLHLLQITFTPVPEPSTYALLGLGLSTLALSVLRRRRAAS